MDVAGGVFPELELLDELISDLEALITESDETPLTIEPTGPPKHAFYRITGSAAVGVPDKKPQMADAVYLDGTRLVLRCNKTEVVKLTQVEVAIQAEKSGRGEATATITGKIQSLKRVPGGYDIEVEIAEMRKSRVTPGQKLRECVDKNDAAGWNRWCQDIRDTIALNGIDLKKADLSGYDLCCSDLSGGDLSGANLSGAILAGADLTECKLDHASVAGADFFRARMSRDQAWILPLTGMLEVESVVFPA